jgi:hypothetical protein
LPAQVDYNRERDALDTRKCLVEASLASGAAKEAREMLEATVLVGEKENRQQAFIRRYSARSAATASFCVARLAGMRTEAQSRIAMIPSAAAKTGRSTTVTWKSCA